MNDRPTPVETAAFMVALANLRAKGRFIVTPNMRLAEQAFHVGQSIAYEQRGVDEAHRQRLAHISEAYRKAGIKPPKEEA